MRPATRMRLTQGLALFGVLLGLFMLADDVRISIIEAELVIPMLLLLSGAGITHAIERDARLVGDNLAPLIAIIGCDGSGKSTLSADLREVICRERPVDLTYLGLGSGEMGLRIRRWPVIGPQLERALSGKARQTRDKRSKVPGLPTALVVYGFSLLRVHRFRRMLALRERGVAIITDRYPQNQVPGFYDGPGLSAARAGGPAVAWLAARERRLYAWMASFRPDVVLRLNVDAQTALTRKPDHDPELLRAKVAVTPTLRFQGARIFEIDAVASYDQVRRQALAQVWPVMAHESPTGERAAAGCMSPVVKAAL